MAIAHTNRFAQHQPGTTLSSLVAVPIHGNAMVSVPYFVGLPAIYALAYELARLAAARHAVRSYRPCMN